MAEAVGPGVATDTCLRPIEVRQATVADVPAVGEMYVAWAAEGITGGFAADSEECIASRIGPHFLVADADGEVLGFISASVRVSEDTGFFEDGQDYLSVDDLYVRPEHRSLGIGASLMQKIMAVAEREGIHRFALSSNTKDFERIVRFYRGCGFETWNVTMFKQST